MGAAAVAIAWAALAAGWLWFVRASRLRDWGVVRRPLALGEAFKRMGEGITKLALDMSVALTPAMRAVQAAADGFSRAMVDVRPDGW